MDNRDTKLNWLVAISLFFLLWLGRAGVLGAAELINLDVDQESGTYKVRLVMELDVTADHVYRALTNYRQLHRMSPSITESRVLPSPGSGVVRVYTRMESCVLIFCAGFTRVEDITQTASGDLIAVIVPGESDFKAGTALWEIAERGERTLLIYEASMQPGFYIPPVIGSYIVMEKIKHELLTSMNSIECCASSQLHLSGRTGGSVSRRTGGSVSTNVQRTEAC